MQQWGQRLFFPCCTLCEVALSPDSHALEYGNIHRKFFNTIIVQRKLELDNKSIIDVIGYNEKADWMYRNLKINEFIYIEGELINNKQENNNLKVQVISIQ